MSELAQVLTEVKKAVVGKDGVLEKVLLAILAGGNILLEDIPGVGKTTLALAFSRALSLEYSRMQFTPDVMPSDITGFSIYDKERGEVRYQPGAILCNLFLADELNRATSRTQSALLEAMEEGQVTVDGVSHPVPQPFIVMATQNPSGASGTQLLPDSQMDRFMVRLTMGYPEAADETELLRRKSGGNPLDGVERVLSREELLSLRAQTAGVYVADELLDYIVRLVGETRKHPLIDRGASPRASLAVAAMARASALLGGRDYVVPRDIGVVFSDTVEHRLLLSSRAGLKGKTAAEVLLDILKAVPAPRIR